MVSSRSSSPEYNSETIQIFIKQISGETIPLSIPSDTSIANLTTLLSLRTAVPEASLRLIHGGRHLPSTSSLSDCNIQKHSTIHLSSPLRGGMPPKKIRCTFKECREAAQRIVGDCGFCNGHYCGRHRLLEDHKCDGLEDCKKESHERNAAQLQSERTQVIKGI